MASDSCANDAPSRALRPDDSSTNCTSVSARSARRWGSSSFVSLASTARKDRCLVCPLTTFQPNVGPTVLQQNQRTVRSTGSLVILRPHGGMCNKSRGSNKNSPQQVRRAWLPFVDPVTTAGRTLHDASSGGELGPPNRPPVLRKLPWQLPERFVLNLTTLWRLRVEP